MKLQVTLLIVPYFLLVLLLKNCAYSGISQGVKQEAHQMVKGMLNAVNKTLSHDDAGKLLLRLAVGGLMLFHGLHKLLDGVGGISGMLVAKGLPGFIAYGVLVGGSGRSLLVNSRRPDPSGGAGAGVHHGGGVADGRSRQDVCA